MESLCKSSCCCECALKDTACKGCTETNGHPCGGTCVAAECIQKNGWDAFEDMKSQIIKEVNALKIRDLTITDLYLLMGSYVNLEYPLPNGRSVKLLDDQKVYFGNQIERPDSERCYGLVTDEHYLLICEYGCNGADPEIILYKKRG